MATVKRKLSSVIVILLCVAAILIGVNAATVLPFIRNLWFGKHVIWRDISVSINDNEYFVRDPKDGNEVFIGDLETRRGNIVIHAGHRSSSEQRVLVADFCRPNECQQVMERNYQVMGREVTEFSFLGLYGEPRNPIFHKYVVVSGGHAWLEYFGDGGRYAIHQPTLDALIVQIVQKAREEKGSN